MNQNSWSSSQLPFPSSPTALLLPFQLLWLTGLVQATLPLSSFLVALSTCPDWHNPRQPLLSSGSGHKDESNDIHPRGWGGAVDHVPGRWQWQCCHPTIVQVKVVKRAQGSEQDVHRPKPLSSRAGTWGLLSQVLQHHPFPALSRSRGILRYCPEQCSS